MELSLPAGNFDCAIAAFENGADSLYFGLELFSARAGADNFSIDDYRRLRKYALDNNKKIYITINTIVVQSMLPRLYELLLQINFYGIDAILVQDWGVVNLVKKYFPNIELHASTQMAAQDADGVQFLKEQGFKRVVLARELSLDEIKEIRSKVKDVELKVFIHGALCYSISGLCYASKFYMGKGSANRGTCRQVCRMDFYARDGKKGALYSLSDLQSDVKIIDELKKIGVESVKVEGRLKSPLYVKWACRYYRAILDNKPTDYIKECEERLKTAFSRFSSTGYFYGENPNLPLTCLTGHRGLKIGEWTQKGGFALTSSLHPHDGVMVLREHDGSVKFEKTDIKIYSNPGDIVKISFADFKPKEGDVLYKIKDYRDNEKVINKDSFELSRFPVCLSTVFHNDKINVKTLFLGKNLSKDYNYTFNLESARIQQDVKSNLTKVFSRKSAYFELSCVDYSFKTDIVNPFIPSSFLKTIARDFYECLDNLAITFFSQKYDANELLDKYKNLKFQNDLKNNLSPVVFKEAWNDYPSSDVILNNISHIQKYLNKECDVGVGAYFNIANLEALDYFYTLFGTRLKCAYISPEVDNQLDLEMLKEHLIYIENPQKTLPCFINRDINNKRITKVFLGDLQHKG